MTRKKHRSGDGPAVGPSQRQLRIGELIRHKVAEMLVRGEIHDDTLGNYVITIPEVRLSPDLKLATIFIMPLGGADPKPVLAALDRHKKYIRGEVAGAVNLKFAPIGPRRAVTLGVALSKKMQMRIGEFHHERSILRSTLRN